MSHAPAPAPPTQSKAEKKKAKKAKRKAAKAARKAAQQAATPAPTTHDGGAVEAASTSNTVDFVWTECTPHRGGKAGTGPGDRGYGASLNGTAQTFVASSTDGGMTLEKRTAVTDLYPAHCGYPDVEGYTSRAPDGFVTHGYTVYKGAYQGLVRDGLGRLQLFYIKWGPSKQLDRPWGSTMWRAVIDR